MKQLFWILIFFYPSFAFACKPGPTSDWFLSIAAIYSKTDQVFVGKVIIIQDLCTTDGPARGDLSETKKSFEDLLKSGCYSYSFKVLKKIKGTFKENDVVQMRSRLKNRAGERVYYGADCKISVGFNSSETYLIFMDAFHPDAYRKVDSIDSTWVKEVSSLEK